jgi:hypothetical protein
VLHASQIFGSLGRVFGGCLICFSKQEPNIPYAIIPGLPSLQPNGSLDDFVKANGFELEPLIKGARRAYLTTAAPELLTSSGASGGGGLPSYSASTDIFQWAALLLLAVTNQEWTGTLPPISPSMPLANEFTELLGEVKLSHTNIFICLLLMSDASCVCNGECISLPNLQLCLNHPPHPLLSDIDPITRKTTSSTTSTATPFLNG